MLIVPTLHPAFILRSSDSDRDDSRFAHVIVQDLRKAAALRKRKPSWDESAIFAKRPDGSWPTIFPTLNDVREFVNDTLGTRIAVDVEATGNTPVDCRLICVGLASENGRVLCFPVLRQGGSKYWDDSEWPDALEALVYLLTHIGTPKVFHNGPFDLVVLKCALDIDVDPWGEDTMLAHHCVDAEMPHKLAFLGSTRLEVRFWKDEVKGDIAWLNLPDERLRVYNLRDCLITIRVLPSILEDVRRWNVESAYREEMQIARIMMRPTIDGVVVDVERRRQLYEEFKKKYDEAYATLQGLSGDAEFKLSGPRVSKFLYETLGFRIERRTESVNPFTGLGNPSSDKKALSMLALQASTPAQKEGLVALARARKFDKRIGTYTGNFDDRPGLRTVKHDDGTQRIHTMWKNITVTGRLASSPNLQNLTDSIKGMLRTKPGYKWVVVDLSRAELRLIAYFANDQELLRMFREDLNLHTINVSLMFKIRSPGFDIDPQTEEYLKQACPKLIGCEYEALPMMGGEGADKVIKPLLKSGKEIADWPEDCRDVAANWETTRRLAKEVVFGDNYKATAVTLYETMKAKRDPKTDEVLFDKTTLREVEAAKAQWESLHPPISGPGGYWEWIVKQAKYNGYLRSVISGRVKRFRGGFKEPEAINWPIQEGVAARVNKAMIKITPRLDAEAPGAMIKIQVHDALYVETPEQYVDTVKKIYREELNEAFRLEPKAGLVFPDAILPGDKPKTGTHLDRLGK